MINHRRASLAAAVVAAAAGSTTAALSGPASGRTASSTIRVAQVERAFKFEDVAPRGGPAKPFTQGDAFVIGGQLLSGKKVVGTSNLVCTTTQPGRRGGNLCEGALVLPRGQITLSGFNTVRDVPATTFAVTGGTGAYARARGTLTSGTERGGRIPLTVRLGS